jgi:hypothetical protein
VLTIPYSYLVALTEAELAAVIAHELAHFAAGDTTLSRWLQSVGEAIGRTVTLLQRYGSVLRYPFRWYAWAYSALIAGWSRRQELAADTLATRLYGATAVAGALGKIEWLSPAFDTYWRTEVRLYLDRGKRPPLGAGFAVFLEAPAIREQIAGMTLVPNSHRLASHPSTARRLAHVGLDTGGARTDDSSPASDLLTDRDALELSLLADISGSEQRSLTAVDWHAGAAQVLPSLWADLLRDNPLSGDLRVSDIPDALEAAADRTQDDPDALQREIAGLGCALSLALVKDGWAVGKSPGRPASFSKAGRAIVPRDELARLANGDLTSAAWIEGCRQLGIDGLTLNASDAEVITESPPVNEPTSVTTDGDQEDGGRVPLELRLHDREVQGPVVRLAFWFALAMGVPSAAALLLLTTAPTTTVAAQVLVRAIGVAILGALAMMIFMRRKTRRNPPVLTVEDGYLRLVHPRLLREPLTIPRDAIRAIAIDSGGNAPDPHARFPVFADEVFESHTTRAGSPRGWVYPGARGQLPRYSLGREEPNALILLNRQVPGPRVRRESMHGPLNGETLVGLFLGVAEPDFAAHALHSTGLLKRLTVADLTKPTSGDEDKELEPLARA